jgi:serine/threonine protein kinase
MGEVWKARDTRLNRLVALKLLPAGTTDDDRRRRFLNEAQAASALNHPNIVTIHDIVNDHGHEAIAMEHIAGRTLDRVILPKGMPLADVLRYGIAIASGVAAAHAAGIVHRDLKPGNVMVTDTGQVKVLDFGLAKLSEATPADGATRTAAAHTDEGTILGTVSYMSPEQAEGRKVDARSDIFSFGALLYEMVTGRRAFRGDTRLSTLSAILRDEPAPIGPDHPGVPHDLERIIARCLRKDAERRYQTMADVRLALEEVKEQSVSGMRVGPVPRASGRRAAVWALIGIGMAAAASGAWLLWSRKSTLPDAPVIIRQFTNYRGSEGTPAVSPDGKLIAFAWEGDPPTGFNIWVKLLDSSQPLQVTSGPETKLRPVWSPDGLHIAYTSGSSPSNQIYEVPALAVSRGILLQVSSRTGHRMAIPFSSRETRAPTRRGACFSSRSRMARRAV